ncbi:proline dehydrogenase family protein [Paenarthrobacter sp. Z7-10]|uniref:proline dehydrogenase family protein n=1 Tax=Paenarthrobacter sp. Z7-10 TaxID=2787635 RepID=UPI0022A93685|nr:proline dehydrogenase family protein [Paenarthrobacter sp. Z7-10]MCZ2404808.1 proline dehydrogenase family protein [Paenarthrobacter sp. Z7-10]
MSIPLQNNRTAASQTLRAWALDEDLKHTVMSNPALAAVATRIARNYTAGDTIADALAAARACKSRGHTVSVEYVGESVRDPAVAAAETEVFLQLIEMIRAVGIPSTVSFDLSHLGSVIDPALGLANARRLAAATAPLGTALMISAEGSDRTDLILDLYEKLSTEYPHVGITLQARLHRTRHDLARVLRYPGTVRLVKGAFLESEDVAYTRGSPELHSAYLNLAKQLIDAGHPTAIATHDHAIIEAIRARHASDLSAGHVEFEMLLGLDPDKLDALRRDGLRTREYVVFGGEWWLYVLNRIAEKPERVYDALIAGSHSTPLRRPAAQTANSPRTNGA